MAHALWNYNGPCKNIHGHSYKLWVTIIGEPVSDEENEKLGMVFDFTDLKKIVKEIIIEKYDHSVIVNSKAPIQLLGQIEQMFEKYEVADYQPTCENMVYHFAHKISEKLPVNLSLFSLKLAETSTSFAEWFASDNE